MSFAPETETLTDPKALLRVPVGLVSPLWPLFAGAAMGGATWWWMTRWARPANLEAMFGAAVEVEAEIAPEPIGLAEPVIEATEAVVAASETIVEAAAEPVVEALAEAEPVLEALLEGPADLEPVGGEAAPISPVLEAAPLEAVEAAPKPKKKPVPPAAD